MHNSSFPLTLYPFLSWGLRLGRNGLERDQHRFQTVQRGGWLDDDRLVNVPLRCLEDRSDGQVLGVDLVQARGQDHVSWGHGLAVHHVVELAEVPGAALQNSLNAALRKN